MIDRQEIMDFARELALDPKVVEKDYVLGWLLAGIAEQAALKPNWVFKGGDLSEEVLLRNLSFLRRPRFHHYR